MLLDLFLTFLKIGAFTFGGGYAMIPLIQKEVVEHKGWLSQQDIADVIAIAETTPGPIAINAATFVGYKTKGRKGALIATLGVVIPSFAIIVLISAFFEVYMQNKIVANAFWGVRLAVIALMMKAFLSMLKECPKNAVSYGIALLSFILVAVFHINVLIIIVAAAIAGIIYQMIVIGRKR